MIYKLFLMQKHIFYSLMFVCVLLFKSRLLKAMHELKATKY